MKNLFDTERQLVESGYLFRITDNGGETQDRFTIVTSDGDYFGSDETPYYALGFFQSGEGIDVNTLDERVEAGTERDLRWIDLPADVRRATFERINQGFADYIESEKCHASRDQAEDRQNVCGTEQFECIYRDGDKFRVRDGGQDDDWTFDSFVEAVRFCLPDVHELSGPEYHSTVDLADEEGGPTPLWDCNAKPEFVMVRADEIKVGDLVDLEGDQYADPEHGGGGELPTNDFEFQLAEVTEVERETADCVRIGGSGFCVGFPVDHMLKRHGSIAATAEADAA
jgi:hypothetical protein